jgi:hypothetical protein
VEDRIALLAQKTPLTARYIEQGWKIVNREWTTTRDRQDALWDAYVTIVLWCGRHGFPLEMIGAIDYASGGMTHEDWIRFADGLNDHSGDRLPQGE